MMKQALLLGQISRRVFFRPFDSKFEMRRSKPDFTNYFFVVYEVKEIAKFKKTERITVALQTTALVF